MKGREHGRIMSVETKVRGDALAEDALAGATTLIVGDAADFDEDGGWLTINDQVVEYLEADDDEGVITLADGLDAAAEEGDAVHVWSTLYDEVVDYQEALVELDGEYDNPEPVVAEVAEGVGDLPEGDRGVNGESCTLLRVSDDEWEVVGVGGRARKSKSIRFEADDVYVLTAADVAAGVATVPLSHRPLNESVTAFWRATPQEPTEYTVNYDDRTVTWPLDGFEEAGDRIWVHYAYRKGVNTPDRGLQPAVFHSVNTAKLSSNGTSLTVPISGQSAGDTLLLFVGRQASLTPPAGWTLLDSPANGKLFCFHKTATGSETSVTVNASTANLMAGAVLAYDGDIVGSDAAMVDGPTVPATYEFQAPTSVGGAPTVVSAVRYDGENDAVDPDETIAVHMSGPTRANININNGIWSLAVAEGDGYFTDATPSAGLDKEWFGIGIGLGREAT